MTTLAVKLLFAPVAVLVATQLARRLGPSIGGFFLGLPMTSVPFLLAVHLTMGGDAARVAAVGNVTGQLTCVLYCILFVRIGPATGGWRTMLAAVGIAAAVAAPTLLLHAPFVVAGLVVLVAAAGVLVRGRVSRMLTHPATDHEGDSSSDPRWALPLRMGLVAVTIAVFSSLAPHVGPAAAAFLSSLPTILMVLGPLTHRAHGPEAAAALVGGCVGSIPGTVAYLVSFLLLAGPVGTGPALALSLAAIPIGVALTAGVAAVARRAGRWVRPGLRRVLRPAVGAA